MSVPNGATAINGECECESTKFYMSNINECESCTDTTYYFDRNTCIKCVANSISSGSACICKGGYRWDNSLN